MLTESSAHSNNINPFQIYPPLSGNGSPQPTRASSVRRIRQGLGIKAIMETIEAKSNPIVINTPKKPLPSTHTTISTANSPTGSKSPILTTAGFSDTIRESQKPKQLSLREKRLQDIHAYRTFCDKSASSPRSETTYNLKPNLINSTAKSTSSGTRFLSPSFSLRKRRNLKISQITTHDNFSGGFSLNGLSREQDSASRLSSNTSPLFQTNSPTQKFLDPSIRIHTDFRDNTRDSPGPKMIELKLLADSQVESQAVSPEGRSPSLRHGISTATLKKRGIEITSPKYSENNYFSAASTYSYGFSGISPTTVNNSPTLGDVSAQTKRVSPNEEYNISPDGWKEYSQKAQDKMPRLKPKLKQRENVTIPDNLNNSDAQKMLQSIKPIYSEFITEKFDESIVNRINTFNAFGFTRDEKNDNHEINMFFNDINRGKDITGTMCMVDLWSSQQRKDVAQKAKFAQEKLMLEKFAFYTSEIQKRLVPTKGQRGKPPKANDSLDKHKYAMLELSKSAEKNQKFALMSPMQRHMELKGKTFHEPKEATVEAQEALKNMNEWNMGLGALMDDLKQFEEQNQNDYLNLLKIRSKKKKTELEGKDKMKTIKNLKEFRSQQPK